MSISALAARFRSVPPVTTHTSVDNTARLQDGTSQSVPPRYRDGRDGVVVERIEQERRAARHQVVRAMLKRMGSMLWR